MFSVLQTMFPLTCDVTVQMQSSAQDIVDTVAAAF
jgi:hypothetical protein